MGNKYGIYQTSSKSCIFYKQDDDGNQSTFNIFVTPSIAEKKEDVFAFIDNEQIKKDNWVGKNIDIKKYQPILVRVFLLKLASSS